MLVYLTSRFCRRSVEDNLKTEKLEVVKTPEPRKHHLFGPSRMAYLNECAAFTNHQRGSAASDEGTFLHEAMESMIVAYTQKKFETIAEQVENLGGDFTEEQTAALFSCAQTVDKFLAKKPGAVHHEEPVKIVRVNGTELNHGYYDLFLIFGKTGILIDFKFGRVPVTVAEENLQCWNYTVGLFQQYPGLTHIGVCLIQPRTGMVSHHKFCRGDAPRMLSKLERVLDRALDVQKSPKTAHQHMKAGTYCEYCVLAGTCTAQANMRGEAAKALNTLPVPKFTGLEVATPQEIALARYWVQILEPAFDEVKKQASLVAEANNGVLSCTLPNGEEIVYEIKERGVDRTLGDAVQIANEFKDVLTLEELLGAADLGLGKFQKIIEDVLVEQAKSEGRKLSKAAAWRTAQNHLEASGLLTKPDGKIKYLKLRKTNNTKQIKESNG